jgi:hypothetical protein
MFGSTWTGIRRQEIPESIAERTLTMGGPGIDRRTAGFGPRSRFLPLFSASKQRSLSSA